MVVALHTIVPRRVRRTACGLVFHVLNRGSRKGLLFESDADYRAFEELLVAALERFRVSLLAYCLMPNHWHFVITTPNDRELARFMHWLTATHARRWHGHRGTNGQGAVYQGRYRAIPVKADTHLLWVCRYVERNACRAGMVERAERWRWCSLWCRENHPTAAWLAPWPAPRPDNWLEYVNEPQTIAELEAFRRLVRDGVPFGDAEWQASIRAGSPPRRRGRQPRGSVLFK
jgi:putative transposase